MLEWLTPDSPVRDAERLPRRCAPTETSLSWGMTGTTISRHARAPPPGGTPPEEHAMSWTTASRTVAAVVTQARVVTYRYVDPAGLAVTIAGIRS